MKHIDNTDIFDDHKGIPVILPYDATNVTEIEKNNHLANISGRKGLLNKLEKTYRPIKPPYDNHFVLTDEAKYYNIFVDDLSNFIKLERDRYERIEKQLNEKS